jgi:hypothetical protein
MLTPGLADALGQPGLANQAEYLIRQALSRCAEQYMLLGGQ